MGQKKSIKKWQPLKKGTVLIMVAQFLIPGNCVGFKIFLAGLQKGVRMNPFFIKKKIAGGLEPAIVANMD